MQSIDSGFVPGLHRYPNGSYLPMNPVFNRLLSKRNWDRPLFFAAWKQSVAMLELQWFGDGTFEGLNKATSKHHLEPRLDVIRAEFKDHSRGYQSHTALLVNFYDSIAGEELMRQAADGRANFLEHFLRLDADRHALLRVLIETNSGWY